MPTIKGSLDQRRALIDVGVQPSVVVPQGVIPVQVPAALNIQPLRGLIDTGAQLTCITRSAAARAGLVTRGKRLIGNVSSYEMHNAYSFVLGAWYSDDIAINQASGYFAFDPVLGADFKDNADFDVLIGMDIIGQGDFFTTRTGDFTWVLG